VRPWLHRGSRACAAMLTSAPHSPIHYSGWPWRFSAMLLSRRALVAMIELTTVEGMEVLGEVRTRIGVELVSRVRGLPCVRFAGLDPFRVLDRPDEGKT